MTVDLKSQVRDYTRFYVSTLSSIEIDELLSERPAETSPGDRPGDDLVVDYLQPRPDGNHAPAGRKRWTGVVTAVAATVLVVVGVVVVADGNSGDVVTDPASSPNVTDPDVTPSVLDPSSSYRWSRVPYDEAVFGGGHEQVMSSVTVGGPGLVAVGQAGSAVAKAAVWTSTDGLTWSRVPGHEEIFAEAPMHSVTAGGPGLVAVGVAFGDATDSSAVWTSADGLTWSRVPHDEAVFGGAVMTSVTAGGPGLVAVGWDGHPHGAESNAVVWTSVDGFTWSRVPHDEAVFGNVTGAWMWSVAAAGPGLVAVGSSTDGAAVWTSVDGFTWSRIPHDEVIFGDAEMMSVTAWGPGVVAVGWDGHRGGEDINAAVWTSDDGIAWSRVPPEEAVFGGSNDQGMTSVTAGGPGLVAVGYDGVHDWGENRYANGLDAAVWTSDDGIAWSRVPHDEAVFGAPPESAQEMRAKPVLEMNSVIAGGPGLVVVGANRAYNTSGATDSDAAVWIGTFED